MKVIKTYEDFVNEEINLRKAAAGVALGAGLAFGSPANSQTNQIQTQQSYKQENKMGGLGDVKLGMSIEDVKSKFPDGKFYYLNEQKTIEVNNYKFDSDTYKALFTFNNGSLNNISLELKDDGFDEDFIKSKFKKMQSKFSKIYGAPIKSATISPIISVIFFLISDQKDKSESWSKSDGTLYLTLNNNKIFLKLEGNKF